MGEKNKSSAIRLVDFMIKKKKKEHPGCSANKLHCTRGKGFGDQGVEVLVAGLCRKVLPGSRTSGNIGFRKREWFILSNALEIRNIKMSLF